MNLHKPAPPSSRRGPRQRIQHHWPGNRRSRPPLPLATPGAATHGNDVLTSVHDQHAVQEFAPYRLGDLLSYQGPARSVAMPNR
jgi:hypothetical protein